MQTVRIFLFIFFTCLACQLQSTGIETHDFHYSRLSLEWNEESSTWQGILRVFTDDLERALSVALNEEINWRLGDKRESPLADHSIQAYVTANWKGRGAANETPPWEWTYVGKEVDYDLTYVYVESQALPRIFPLELETSGFFELFDDQVNEVTLTVHKSSRREWLSSESDRVIIESIEP